MTEKEIHILAWVCCGFMYAFLWAGAPLIALGFGLAGIGLFGWYIWGFWNRGGGPRGPVKPA